MDKIQLQSFAKKELSNWLHESGSILYSSHETLKPGKVYLLGYNPGGISGCTLGESIDNLLNRTKNAYLDEVWDKSKGKGEAILQKRVRCLLKKILELEPEEVCASNLIFIRSKTAQDVNKILKKSDIEKFWNVHKAIINIVKPKLILTFGNGKLSPYQFLKQHLQINKKDEYRIDANHGNWKLKCFETKIDNLQVYIAGLPHLSRYSLNTECNFDDKYSLLHDRLYPKIK